MLPVALRIAGAGRLAAAWFAFWAGFWTLFFSMLAVADPGSVDPGEPAAFVKVFSLPGLASGLCWAACEALAPRPGGTARASPLRSAALGAFAAAMPVLAMGKFSQILVLAPVGAAIGAVLAFVARSGARTRDGRSGGWLALAKFLERGFARASAGIAGTEGRD